MATSQASDNKISPYLQRIISEISISEETAKENVQIMRETVNSVVSAMKEEDPLFCNLFQTIVYTGSYFEGLRITEPNEFDLNLSLSLPFKAQDVEIVPSPNHPAFAKYCLKQMVPTLLSNHPKWNVYRQLERHFDDARCLRRDTLQQWLEGVVTKASNSPKFHLPSSVEDVKFRKSGPAFTMQIEKHNGEFIDIDLVPCIEGLTKKWPKGFHNCPRISQLNGFDDKRCLYQNSLQNSLEEVVTGTSYSQGFYLPSARGDYYDDMQWPFQNSFQTSPEEVVTEACYLPEFHLPSSVNEVHKKTRRRRPKVKKDKEASGPTKRKAKKNEKRAWYLIPKTYKDPNGQVAQSDPTLWRIAMPEAEKALIDDFGCVKILIKLFKRLRDKQNWKSIASYYIKTVINLAIDEHPSEDYWHAKNMGKLFMEMLYKLRDTIQERELPHYFYRTANLLAQLSSLEASNIVGRINTIIKDIGKNPENVLNYF